MRVYVREDLTPGIDEVLRYSDGSNEVLVLNIKQKDIILAVVYRPPNVSTKDVTEMFQMLKQPLEELERDDCAADMTITGDFNFPHLERIHEQREQPQEKLLLNITENLFMSQVIKEPTRRNNILDLVFTNNHMLIHCVNIAPTTISDHKFIEITTKLEMSSTKPPNPGNNKNTAYPAMRKLNFFSKKTDWEKIRSILRENNWGDLNSLPPSEILHRITTACTNACLGNVPPKSDSSKRKIIPRDRRLLMRKRAKILKEIPRDNQQKVNLEKQLGEVEKKLRESH